MGDERDTTRQRPDSTEPSQKVLKFWRAMLDLFGTRWTENYGSHPAPIWISAIGMLTNLELKTALQQLLTSGVAHPPTLPELLGLARTGQRTTTRKYPEQYTPEWHEQRREFMARIAKQSAERGVQFTAEQKHASKLALDLATYSGNVSDPAYIAARKAWEQAAFKKPSEMTDSEYPF
jgi:hypothetical protein